MWMIPGSSSPPLRLTHLPPPLLSLTRPLNRFLMSKSSIFYGKPIWGKHLYSSRTWFINYCPCILRAVPVELVLTACAQKCHQSVLFSQTAWQSLSHTLKDHTSISNLKRVLCTTDKMNPLMVWAFKLSYLCHTEVWLSHTLRETVSFPSFNELI